MSELSKEEIAFKLFKRIEPDAQEDGSITNTASSGLSSRSSWKILDEYNQEDEDFVPANFEGIAVYKNGHFCRHYSYVDLLMLTVGQELIKQPTQ